MMRGPAMAVFLFIFVSLIWGSNFILMKKAGLAFGPISIAACRTFGGALIVGLFWLAGSRACPFTRSDRGPLAFLILVGYVWPYSILPWLIGRNGSGFIGMVIGLVPLMTILASIPLLKVYPTRRQLVGVLGGLACLLLILADGLQRSVPLLDLVLTATVPACYAVGNTYIRKRFSTHNPLAMTGLCLFSSAAVLLPLSLGLESWPAREVEDLRGPIWALTGVATLATGLAVYIFYWLIQRHGPLYAGMVAYVVPCGALLWGWFDRETVSSMQVLGLVGILAMVALVQGERVKEDRPAVVRAMKRE